MRTVEEIDTDIRKQRGDLLSTKLSPKTQAMAAEKIDRLLEERIKLTEGRHDVESSDNKAQ